MQHIPSNNGAAQHIHYLTCMLALQACIGCHGRAVTVDLQGDVSYAGQSIERGTIDFVPIDNTPGPSAVAPITKGHYAIDPKWGLLPDGVYQVRIAAFRKTARKEANRVDRAGPPVEIEEDFIPPVYNSKSTLRIRVAELTDRKKVDFRLTEAASPASK